jgi:hypothetical protein
MITSRGCSIFSEVTNRFRASELPTNPFSLMFVRGSLIFAKRRLSAGSFSKSETTSFTFISEFYNSTTKLKLSLPKKILRDQKEGKTPKKF